MPLRMPWIDSIWLADQRLVDGGDDGNAAADRRLEGDRSAQLAGQSKSSRPCSASTALLAVMTSLPLCNNLSMIERSGSRPPMSCTTASISGIVR